MMSDKQGRQPITPKISIVFFGSGPVAAASLRHLGGIFKIEGVVTKPVTESEMAAAAPGTPIHLVDTKHDLTSFIATKPFQSPLGLIVDFGIIVERAVIDYFPLGIINSHFSLLPRWRGADPISFAILGGDQKTGVSLMLIDEELDTGKLIAQKGLVISPEDTTPSLTNRLVKLSNAMLAEYVPRYVQGKIKPRTQPHPDRATYSRKLAKDDGLIEWDKPAAQIALEIRAYSDWPKSRTVIADKEVIITKAHAVPGQQAGCHPGDIEAVYPTGSIMVCTGKGSLCIEALKPAGKNEMPAKAFLAGYGKTLNTQI